MRRKNKLINTIISEEEYKLIHEKMKLLNTNNMSAYVRKIVIDGLIIEVNDKAFDDVAVQIN